MKVADIIKLCGPKIYIRIEESYVREFCTHSEEDCYGMDCDECEDCEMTKELDTHTLFTGYANEVPIQFAEKRVKGISVSEDSPTGRRGKHWLVPSLALVIPEVN